jgi:folate-binding protein YgfZ
MPALFDLSDRVKLRLSGSDRVRFLNGQVTNDVRKANASLSMPACVLSAKGKITALVFIAAGENEIFLDSDPELRQTLPQRLERYVIADDVTIEDVTERYALFHVTAESPPTLPNDAHWRRAKRFGLAGWDVVLEEGERDRARRLFSAHFPVCDAECAERLRIEQGIARWGRELTDQIIPVEANLEEDAIDYAKGCYIGQEIISRMKMSGQTNKRLCGLVSLGRAALSPAMRLFTAESGSETGWITSATRSDLLGKEIALGYVKRGFNEPGTRLSARGAGESVAAALAVQVVGLPFISQTT